MQIRASGGSTTQSDVRGWMGGDPNTDPLMDKATWIKYGEKTSHLLNGSGSGMAQYSLNNVVNDMNSGTRVALNIRTAIGGHSVVMDNVMQKTITRASGKIITRMFYTVMNPANGGSYMQISAKTFLRAYNIFYIFP